MSAPISIRRDESVRTTPESEVSDRGIGLATYWRQWPTDAAREVRARKSDPKVPLTGDVGLAIAGLAEPIEPGAENSGQRCFVLAPFAACIAAVRVRATPSRVMVAGPTWPWFPPTGWPNGCGSGRAGTRPAIRRGGGVWQPRGRRPG